MHQEGKLFWDLKASTEEDCMDLLVRSSEVWREKKENIKYPNPLVRIYIGNLCFCKTQICWNFTFVEVHFSISCCHYVQHKAKGHRWESKLGHCWGLSLNTWTARSDELPGCPGFGLLMWFVDSEKKSEYPQTHHIWIIPIHTHDCKIYNSNPTSSSSSSSVCLSVWSYWPSVEWRGCTFVPHKVPFEVCREGNEGSGRSFIAPVVF